RELELELTADSDGGFLFQYDSALLHIQAQQPEGSPEEFIQITCLVAHAVPASAELCAELLEHNAGLPFGAFALLNGNIILRQTLLGGEHIDIDEFRITFFAMAIAADRFDDMIVKRYGGRRAIDLIKEHGRLDFAWAL
ncbi:MAG: YbjN domain-containing protein, partial [Leptospiraceae bacterium]|nr:YbjN domain-containing protein [Leptospiraceae bacterium]